MYVCLYFFNVFERSELHEFLIQAAAFVELVLFTTGFEGMPLISSIFCNISHVILLLYVVSCGRTGYAKPLVDRIDTGKI